MKRQNSLHKSQVPKCPLPKKWAPFSPLFFLSFSTYKLYNTQMTKKHINYIIFCHSLSPFFPFFFCNTYIFSQSKYQKETLASRWFLKITSTFALYWLPNPLSYLKEQTKHALNWLHANMTMPCPFWITRFTCQAKGTNLTSLVICYSSVNWKSCWLIKTNLTSACRTN